MYIYISAAYSQSKLANILFSTELARRLQARGSTITSNSLHPGLIHTNLAHHIVNGVKQSTSELLAALGERYFMTAALTADDGALTQVSGG